jgi:hypothetical protein
MIDHDKNVGQVLKALDVVGEPLRFAPLQFLAKALGLQWP